MWQISVFVPNRYNMTVDVGLGATLDSIKYHLKGKVISTDNLQQDFRMEMTMTVSSKMKAAVLS